MNADGFGHTVTSDDFDVEVGANGSETLTIDAAGRRTRSSARSTRR